MAAQIAVYEQAAHLECYGNAAEESLPRPGGASDSVYGAEALSNRAGMYVGNGVMDDQSSGRSVVDEEKTAGLDSDTGSWGDYPVDELLIRNNRRTVHDVLRRIEQGRYVMNQDFQRDFIWPEDKQSKLIESVIMRIPLPVFYTVEDREGRMIVVDGLQRLATIRKFVNDDLRLRLPDRDELNGKRFSDLPPRFKNRIEDCNLIFHIFDSKTPECVRLEILDRVNG